MTPYRIAVVCLGNICRSPMAAVVLAERVADAGLAQDVEVVSAGTGPWHVGHPMDDRAAERLTRAGYDATRHRARQIDEGWFETCDLVLAMDAQNHRDVTELAAGLASPRARVAMFRDYDPDGAGDVPDPYFGGADGFEQVLAMVERTSAALVDELAPVLRARAAEAH